MYLLIVALPGITLVGVRAGIRVPGYAANTGQNIAAGPTLTPVSLAIDLAIATIFAFVGVTVYLLLRRIDGAPRGRWWPSWPWPPG